MSKGLPKSFAVSSNMGCRDPIQPPAAPCKQISPNAKTWQKRWRGWPDERQVFELVSILVERAQRKPGEKPSLNDRGLSTVASNEQWAEAQNSFDQRGIAAMTAPGPPTGYAWQTSPAPAPPLAPAPVFGTAPSGQVYPSLTSVSMNLNSLATNIFNGGINTFYGGMNTFNGGMVNFTGANQQQQQQRPLYLPQGGLPPTTTPYGYLTIPSPPYAVISPNPSRRDQTSGNASLPPSDNREGLSRHRDMGSSQAPSQPPSPPRYR